MRQPIDFHHVDAQHIKVHERLTEWARWVRPKEGGIAPIAMFSQYRSNSWQWHRQEVHIAVNELEALETERAVSALPDMEREAIRWCYGLRRGGPGAMARRLATGKETLLLAIHKGRSIISERICEKEHETA